MKYERLTTRNEVGKPISVLCEHCHIQDKCDFSKETCCNELADRLAELQDKIESGKMLELPFAIGEKVYLARRNRNYKWVVSRTTISMYIQHRLLLVKCACDSEWHELRDVFTDKSRAEARLKELQGK